jgi:hypothetical protein
LTEQTRRDAYLWRLRLLVFSRGILLAHLGMCIVARSRWTLLWPPTPALRWTVLTLALPGVAGCLTVSGEKR